MVDNPKDVVQSKNMNQIESKYTQFPIALEIPEIPREKRIERDAHILEWKKALGLRFNVDYVNFEFQKGPQRNQTTHTACAFKNEAIALQFKLKFAGY